MQDLAQEQLRALVLGMVEEFLRRVLLDDLALVQLPKAQSGREDESRNSESAHGQRVQHFVYSWRAEVLNSHFKATLRAETGRILTETALFTAA